MSVAREIGTGIVVTVVVLLLLDLAGQLQRGGETAVLGTVRWSLVALLAVGAIAGGLPAMARRSWVVPAVAAAVLAWPVVAATTVVPGPPSWVPLLGATVGTHTAEAVLLVGAFAGVAITRRG